jgi:hypothetical protein
MPSRRTAGIGFAPGSRFVCRPETRRTRRRPILPGFERIKDFYTLAFR